jgi:hypothetical protein
VASDDRGYRGPHPQVALFPDDRQVELDGTEAVQVRLKEMELHRPRQWGACTKLPAAYSEIVAIRSFVMSVGAPALLFPHLPLR